MYLVLNERTRFFRNVKSYIKKISRSLILSIQKYWYRVFVADFVIVVSCIHRNGFFVSYKQRIRKALTVSLWCFFKNNIY